MLFIQQPVGLLRHPLRKDTKVVDRIAAYSAFDWREV